MTARQRCVYACYQHVDAALAWVAAWERLFGVDTCVILKASPRRMRGVKGAWHDEIALQFCDFCEGVEPPLEMRYSGR